MIFKDIKTDPEENAYGLGIRSFSVVSLDTPNLAVPDNIYISRVPSPAQAGKDLYWANHRSPINFAVWVPPPSAVPLGLRKRIYTTFKTQPELFSAVRFNWANYNKPVEPMRKKASRMKRKFKIAAERVTSNTEQRKLIRDWGNITVDTLKAFTDDLPNSRLDIQYLNSTRREKRHCGHQRLELHLDGYRQDAVLSVSKGGLKKQIHPTIRCIWSQNDIGTYAADQRDVEIEDGRIKRFTNPNPVFYAAPPWSLSMFNGRQHSCAPPVVHSTPIVLDNAGLSRIAWDIVLEFPKDQTLAADDYFDWLEKRWPSAPSPHFDECLYQPSSPK